MVYSECEILNVGVSWIRNLVGSVGICMSEGSVWVGGILASNVWLILSVNFGMEGGLKSKTL